MTALLVCLVFGVGPELDVAGTSSATARDRELLPAGRHVGSAADLWFPELVNQRFDGGGIALFDEMALSAHGVSFTQTAWLLNGLPIGDPARPGTPLFVVPWHAWEETRFASLWSTTPAFDWRLTTPGDAIGVRFAGGGGGHVGGGTWIPRDSMDREPATVDGAPAERRKLELGGELEVAAQAGRTRLHVERIEHRHTYPTLTAGDAAERTTALVQSRLFDGLDLVAGWQGVQRSHDGAEHRHPDAFTHALDSNALFVHLGSGVRFGADTRLDARTGLAWRGERRDLRAVAPLVWDIEDEWTLLHRPRFGDELTRLRWDAAVTATLGAATTARLTGGVASVQSLPEIPGGRTATTYLRGSDPSNDVTVWDARRRSSVNFGEARLELGRSATLAGVTLDALVALDHASTRGLSHTSPAFGVRAVRDVGLGDVFLLLRREPEVLTYETAGWLDPRAPSGRRYRWDDDGDGVPEAGEEGELLARTGGPYHEAGDLSRPTDTRFALGWRTASFGPFRAVFTGVARVLTDRYIVKLAGPAADSYRRSRVGDFDDAADERDSEIPAWPRTPGTEGQERYALTNAGAPSYWIGAEIQLLSEAAEDWFVNLSATGYWNFGNGAFGIYADRNDPGIVDDVTADPNARVHSWGRNDSDRAFSIKLLTGWEPLEDLWATLALRYRDGQPQTRFYVVDLPQGPTSLMVEGRGDPVPRFTFHMTIDVRLRWEIALGPVPAALFADCYNLFGSGTEIHEDLRTGAMYRTPLEMMPGRALFFGVTLAMP